MMPVALSPMSSMSPMSPAPPNADGPDAPRASAGPAAQTEGAFSARLARAQAERRQTALSDKVHDKMPDKAPAHAVPAAPAASSAQDVERQDERKGEEPAVEAESNSAGRAQAAAPCAEPWSTMTSTEVNPLPATARRALPHTAAAAAAVAAAAADPAATGALALPQIAPAVSTVIAAFASPAGREPSTLDPARGAIALGSALDAAPGLALHAGAGASPATGSGTAADAGSGAGTHAGSRAGSDASSDASGDALSRTGLGPGTPGMPDSGAAVPASIPPAAAFMPASAASALAAPGVPHSADAHAHGLHVAAAVDTPAFAPALAHQVGVMVREGLGLATLTLNPPELGPVSVQIVVDGRQARVDFGAEMALTRTAIENSLPHLASALQDVGLTLSGGGVFDGRPRREAPTWAGHRKTAGDAAGGSTGASIAGISSLTVPRGLVDLIA